MTNITHSFASAKSDGADATLVRPSDWNAEHVITGALELAEISSPSTPASAKSLIYPKSDGRWYTKGDDGVEIGPLGAAGSTIQYPPLKPGSPLDDFAAASLDGAWSARSNTGSFTTGHVLTQSIDGSHVDMMFAAQSGAIYRSTTNVDQEWQVGGMRPMGVAASSDHMFGIAIVDTSGNGVGVVSYSDNNAYLAKIDTWTYNSQQGTISGTGGAGLGHSAASLGNEPVWMRLTRVTNTWDAYISVDGRAWTHHSSATYDRTITAAHLVVGMLYPTGAKSMRLIADWVHKV